MVVVRVCGVTLVSILHRPEDLAFLNNVRRQEAGLRLRLPGPEPGLRLSGPELPDV